jgi:hypothetical protein
MEETIEEGRDTLGELLSAGNIPVKPANLVVYMADENILHSLSAKGRGPP